MVIRGITYIFDLFSPFNQIYCTLFKRRSLFSANYFFSTATIPEYQTRQGEIVSAQIMFKASNIK
ncbi:MAG: hypothetical protein AAFY50_16320 [Cyanobacteria bacterium J06648_1]